MRRILGSLALLPLLGVVRFVVGAGDKCADRPGDGAGMATSVRWQDAERMAFVCAPST